MKSLKEGGKPLSAVDSIHVVQFEADAVTCRIGAGQYLFEFPILGLGDIVPTPR